MDGLVSTDSLKQPVGYDLWVSIPISLLCLGPVYNSVFMVYYVLNVKALVGACSQKMAGWRRSCLSLCRCARICSRYHRLFTPQIWLSAPRFLPPSEILIVINQILAAILPCQQTLRLSNQRGTSVRFTTLNQWITSWNSNVFYLASF